MNAHTQSMTGMGIVNNRLVLQKHPIPSPRPHEVIIKTAYAGVNRADLMQLQGHYPPPKGASALPGLEVSGTITVVGHNVRGWKKGDKVMALLTGGGYAEYCAAPASLLLPIPRGLTLEQAAALPEALYTCAMALCVEGTLKAGQRVLLHSGASGIGTLGIQLAKILGAEVVVTAGTKAKCTLCKKLGASVAINYKEKDFSSVIEKNSVDLVVDTTGGDNLPRNIQLLKPDGTLIILSFLRGARGELNISQLLFKRLTIKGITLRSKPLKDKKIIKNHVDKLIPRIGNGKIAPVIDRVYPLKDAEKALLRMEQNLNIGKIVLQV